MSIGTITLTRADHGRRMTLEEYSQAESEEGQLFELGRGVLAVIEVPQWRHLRRVDRARSQFVVYRELFPRRLHTIASGGECRLPIDSLQSDRHPDLAVYKSPPPEGLSADDFWRHWVPEIVIEVVSLTSVVRDYEEKPDEYWDFGVKEYWIIDPEKDEMLVLRRTEDGWKRIVVAADETYKTPLLRGFEFDLAAVLAADA